MTDNCEAQKNSLAQAILAEEPCLKFFVPVFLCVRMVASPCRGESLASVLDGNFDVVQVTSVSQDGTGLSSGRGRDAGGSCPGAGRGSECGCRFASQGGAECGHLGASGHGGYRESREKVASPWNECNSAPSSRRYPWPRVDECNSRPLIEWWACLHCRKAPLRWRGSARGERVQQRTFEQVDVLWCPGEAVVAIRFTTSVNK